jgi:hypothetical protein
MATYPQNQILLNIDLARFKKINSQPNLQPRVKINLPDYISCNQLVMLDIVNSNIYDRPICFTSIEDLLAGYLQVNGMVYQFLPLDSNKKELNQKISVLKTKDYLLKKYTATPGNNFSSGLVADYNMDALAYDMYFNVAEYYSEKNKSDSAIYILSKLFKAYDNELPFTLNKNGIGAVLLDVGRQSSGTAILMDYIEMMYRLHKNPSSSYPYFSRKTVLNAAINVQLIFEIAKLDRTRIDEIVTLLNREPH